MVYFYNKLFPTYLFQQTQVVVLTK